VPLGSMKQGIKMLLNHRIDAMVSTEHSFYFNLKALNISTDQVMPILVVNETPGDLYFSKKSKNKHLIAPFKEALVSLKKKGIINNIFYNNNYMPPKIQH
jgi:ABC-type amino acid transport substrate-binding protein